MYRSVVTNDAVDGSILLESKLSPPRSLKSVSPRYLPHPPTAQLAVPRSLTPRMLLLPSLRPDDAALLLPAVGGRYDRPWCRCAYVRLYKRRGGTEGIIASDR